jgi:hypothetical protein
MSQRNRWFRRVAADKPFYRRTCCDITTGKENAMPRAFQFDVDAVVEKLNRILQMELAAVVYYTHYSL